MDAIGDFQSRETDSRRNGIAGEPGSQKLYHNAKQHNINPDHEYDLQGVLNDHLKRLGGMSKAMLWDGRPVPGRGGFPLVH